MLCRYRLICGHDWAKDENPTSASIQCGRVTGNPVWLEGPEKEDGGKMSCRVCLAKIRDTAPLQSEIGSGGIKCGLACSTGEELG
jgi:hypothetical protein